jgi:hypothetical protein
MRGWWDISSQSQGIDAPGKVAVLFPTAHAGWLICCTRE